MTDPTTLICGHSLCLLCSGPKSAAAIIREPQEAIAVGMVATASISPEIGHPLDEEVENADNDSEVDSQERPLTVSPSPPAEPTAAQASPKAIMTDCVCSVAGCGKLTKARSTGRVGLRTNYVLQKITLLIRTQVSLSNEEDAQSEREAQQQRQERQGSSPDDECKDFESSKRRMGKRRSGWSANKKSRKYLPTLVTDVLSELECQVCVTLLYEPMTSPCGHTFCKRCLFRSLDHSNRCPLCRTELPGFNFFISAPINHTISNLIITTFPMMYEERREVQLKEEGESGLDTPVFVCMVSFPHMPTNLHIYEPRYRLMMRRAMDSGSKRFAMVLPSRAPGGYSQYGTMLEIQNLHMFDDGRSLVETVGVHRVKVLESGTLDGYTVGRVERIEDITDEEEAELERLALERFQQRQKQERQSRKTAAAELETEKDMEKGTTASMPGAIPSAHAAPSSGSGSAIAAIPAIADPNDTSVADSTELTNDQLLALCKDFVEALRTGSTPWLLQRLNSTLPPMPEDPRRFTWWMAMLMPIDDHEKAKLLQITSYRLRLRLIVFWIQQMQDSWWFSRGCTIA